MQITAKTTTGREHTGRIVEVTIRDRRFTYLRLDAIDGPVVRVTNRQFAALGPLAVGHNGLRIGDQVHLVVTRNGVVTRDVIGKIESTVLDRGAGIGLGVMIHDENSACSCWAPLGTFTSPTVTVTATIVKAA